MKIMNLHNTCCLVVCLCVFFLRKLTFLRCLLLGVYSAYLTPLYILQNVCFKCNIVNWQMFVNNGSTYLYNTYIYFSYLHTLGYIVAKLINYVNYYKSKVRSSRRRRRV